MDQRVRSAAAIGSLGALYAAQDCNRTADLTAYFAAFYSKGQVRLASGSVHTLALPRLSG